ncbi:MAG: primosomal protein N' [Candidatus Omnitrophica bacterium]|nr:primosomal protein N' [Candidatus Omnitrophota bacterium]
MKAYNIAEVAIDIPKQDFFHYIIPDAIKTKLTIGKRVVVPFGNKERIGFIVGLLDSSPIKRLKEILAVLDDVAVLDADMLKLTKWLSEYYLCSQAEAIKAALPSLLTKKKVRISFEEQNSNANYGFSFPRGKIKNLPKNLSFQIEKCQNKIFLLHYKSKEEKFGIFLSSISKVLSKGNNCIFLVPEILYVNEYREILQDAFGDIVSILHSGLTEREQFSNWKRIIEGKALIALGTRMTIFSPFKKMGLIIVEDEHQGAYKQDRTPRYDAVNVSLKRSEFSNAIVILASPTPRVESYFKAKQGEFILLKTRDKKPDIVSTKIKVVDMRDSYGYRTKNRFLSRMLQEEVGRVFLAGNKNKVVIFVNRRGFSTYCRCIGCGFIVKCSNCNNPLVYHFDNKMLICHFCNFSIRPPDICPECGKYHIEFAGFGTEKVESEIARLFPVLKTERLDSDAYSRRIGLDKIIDKFEKNEIDVLIGTTMALKVLELEYIRLIAILSLDTFLNLPDFRSTEKMFNTLMHILMSKGMSHPDARLVIQTYLPDLYLIKAIKRMDYNGFYRKELSLRRDLYYPPFCHLTSISIKSKIEDTAKRISFLLKEVLDKEGFTKKLEILGPSPHRIKKIRGYFIWELILKAKDNNYVCNALKQIFKKIGCRSRRYISIDIDPR